MIGLVLTAFLALPTQDPAKPPADAVRVAVQADGSAVILRQDGTPPQPLFGRMLGRAENDSLFNALANYGLLGNLGLFVGAPRPLSTMLDAERYCEQAGLKRTPEALRALLGPPAANASAAQRQRHALDRLVAITLLARSSEPAAREALARAQTDADRFAAAWAKQLVAPRDATHPVAAPLTDHVASVLANAPADTQVVFVVDHAHMPRWQDIWRLAAEVGRAVTREQLAMMAMEPDEMRTALAHADLVVERTGLLAYEFARRFGNASIERTVVAAPAAFATGPSSSWVHFAGAFEPDRLATGLRAEGFAVTTDKDTVQAIAADETKVRGTTTSLTIDATLAAKQLGAERAKTIAAGFDAPHLALGIALLGDDALGIVPGSIARLVDALRTVHLRHDDADGAHLWLDLHYADAKPATVAATALGALLTAATGAAGDAPNAVRELLREIKVHREGTVVTAEVELDTALGPWLEKLIPQLAR